MPSSGFDVRINEHPLDTGGCARDESGPSLGEQPSILRMESVDVLIWWNGIEHRYGIDMIRQRELYKNSISDAPFVLSNCGDEGGEFVGLNRGGNPDDLGVDTDTLGRGRLTFHI